MQADATAAQLAALGRYTGDKAGATEALIAQIQQLESVQQQAVADVLALRTDLDASLKAVAGTPPISFTVGSCL